MQFHRVLQVLHVDELPQALEGAKRVERREPAQVFWRFSVAVHQPPPAWLMPEISRLMRQFASHGDVADELRQMLLPSSGRV